MTASASPLLDEDNAAFVQSGVSIVAASRGEDLVPSIARVSGCRVSADRRAVSIYLPHSQALELVEDVRASGRIAVVFSRPSTHRTLQLKADDATALIPIVLVTALEDHQSRVRGIQAGADDFLSKPVRAEELVARVKTLRRLHETRRELEMRRLAAEVERKEQIRKAFSRYISPRLTERIISPPPIHGGIRSSRVSRPYRAPMPMGP